MVIGAPADVRLAAVAGKSRYRLFEGPLGTFALIQAPSGDLSANWLDGRGRTRLKGMEHDHHLLADVARELEKYFKGQPADFSMVPTPAGSEFYVRCWEACRRIPRGQTVSYGRLAEMAASDTSASRAAGQAMRHNPLPVIVPCHRVVAADGRLHGFAGTTDPQGWALGLKRSLLALESAAELLA